MIDDWYRRFGKRLFDLAAAAALMVLMAPVMILIAVLVRVRMGSPVLFRQRRVGRREQEFSVIKFRTMTDTSDTDGNLLTDAERLTRLGTLLRATSLDELPQLWNVLAGEMSLVGPRPLFPRYLPFYSDREARRNEVRPGITGLAQISGRHRLAWDTRLEMDVQYVDSRALQLDLSILWATAKKVVVRDDKASEPANLMDLDEERSQ